MFKKSLISGKKILFFTSLLFNSQCGKGAYVGGSFLYRAISPKLHWTDPVTQWLVDSSSKAESALEAFYMRYQRGVEKKEAYFNHIILARNEEKILMEQWYCGPGGSLWFGHGKKLKDNFYVGFDVAFSYVHQTLEDNDSGVLIQFDQPTFFYRQGLSGKSTYANQIGCKDHYAAHFSLRLGYYPVPKLLTYIKIGSGVFHYAFNPFDIVIHNDVNVIRYGDPSGGELNVSMLEDLPQTITYHLSEDHHFSASICLGAGIEHQVTSQWFLRAEYSFDFLFSHRLHTFSQEKMNYDTLEASYALKYQSIVHHFSCGFGRRF